MRPPKTNPPSLWNALRESGDRSGCHIADGTTQVPFREMLGGSVLDGSGDRLRGRSVLVMTTGQCAAALALLELDGIARRLVLYPPDLSLDYLPFVVQAASVDAIVSDRSTSPQAMSGPEISGVQYFTPRADAIESQNYDRSSPLATEWVLLTSGTLGAPKLVVHTLSSLTGAIDSRAVPAQKAVWSTFYDIRRYGGLQIFLRAVLTSASLILWGARESTADFLIRARSEGVTHISGTPSHWRRALMSPSAQSIAPAYVRLSGEIADQAILNHLRAVYPQSKIAHAFASTEAGVAFAIEDGIAGFPAGVLEHTPNVEMKVVNRTLRIRSARVARCYLGDNAPALKHRDGFVDTGDMIELRNDRFFFVGRRDGLINVGGMKVHPEEVEAVINRHPEVHMSLVRAKRNPVTGAVVVADVVLRTASRSAGRDAPALQSDILLFCREELSLHKVPAAINFVPDLAVAESGKIRRVHA